VLYSPATVSSLTISSRDTYDHQFSIPFEDFKGIISFWRNTLSSLELIESFPCLPDSIPFSDPIHLPNLLHLTIEECLTCLGYIDQSSQIISLPEAATFTVRIKLDDVTSNSLDGFKLFSQVALSIVSGPTLGGISITETPDSDTLIVEIYTATASPSGTDAFKLYPFISETRRLVFRFESGTTANRFQLLTLLSHALPTVQTLSVKCNKVFLDPSTLFVLFPHVHYLHIIDPHGFGENILDTLCRRMRKQKRVCGKDKNLPLQQLTHLRLVSTMNDIQPYIILLERIRSRCVVVHVDQYDE